jgi:hypothetical protein
MVCYSYSGYLQQAIPSEQRISSSLLSLHHLHHHAAYSPSATSTKHARSFLAQCRLHCHHKHHMEGSPTDATRREKFHFWVTSLLGPKSRTSFTLSVGEEKRDEQWTSQSMSAFFLRLQSPIGSALDRAWMTNPPRQTWILHYCYFTVVSWQRFWQLCVGIYMYHCVCIISFLQLSMQFHTRVNCQW